MISLKKLRFEKGLSQREVSEKCGMSRGAYAQLEMDSCHTLSVERARQLADIFNCTLIDVYGADILKIPISNNEEKELLLKKLKEEL